MAWGGGGGFGPPIGGGGRPGAPIGTLPFGGIPAEMQRGVDVLVAEEPDHTVDVHFSQIPDEHESRILNLWQLLVMYPRFLIASGILVVVVALASQAGPYLTGLAINDGMTTHHDLLTVAVLAGVYVASVIISALGQRWLVQVTGRLAAEVMNDLRVHVFTHIQRMSLDYFTEEKAGVTMTRMTSDIENLQQLLQTGLAQIVQQILTMIVITVVLFAWDVRLAWITVLLVVPLLTIASLWFRLRSEAGYDKVRDGIANVLSDLAESLHGFRVVTAYNRQRHNVIRHRNVVGEYKDANDYTAHINAVYGPGTQFLGVVGQAVILGVGGEMVLHHQLSLGALFAFFLYLNRFFQPIQLLTQQYNTYQQGQSSIFKLRTLLGTVPSTVESTNAIELPEIHGDITFEHVNFAYDDDPVLTNVDIRIAEGETVAFVGPTGAGKSTMAKLITRFYDPTSGRVLIDGHDLKDVTLSSLRRQLGVVPQEPFLFAGTVGDNIGFARPGATPAQIHEAVDAVGLTDLIARLPDGIDTVVHERGQSLSSGERQLIALARAFLAQPRVLVLDEATSNLDLQSETRIERALDVLLENRTAVLIAHRLSTAMRADRIVVVNEGRIAESGSHAELVERGGIYAQMYETWSSQAEHSTGAS